MSTAPKFRKDHLLEVDGLRGIAVLLVLWIHLPVGAFGEGMARVRATVMAGNLGVDLFFVLSGFLITRILLVERSAGVPVRYFMARRFFRIFPIYYLTILALLPLLSRNQALAALTYTSNYAQLLTPYTSPLEHAWSLAVEEHFYLLWPPVVAWLAPAMSRRVLLGVVIPLSILSLLGAVAWGPWGEHPESMKEFVLRSSTVRFLSLAVGALMAFHEGWFRDSRRRALGLMAVALGAGAVLSPAVLDGAGLIEAAAGGGATGSERAGAVRVALYVVAFPCLGCALLAFAVAWSGSRTPLAWLLRAGPLRAVGRVSYALYLYHFPIFQQRGLFGVNPEAPPLVRTALALGLCFGLATMSYYAVERPLLRLGGRFRGKRGEREPMVLGSLGSWGFAAAFVLVLFWTLRGGAERLVTWAMQGL